MTPAFRHRREWLRRQPDARFVGLQEYLKLAISRETLDRTRDDIAMISGFRDRENGQTVYIGDEFLMSACLADLRPGADVHG